MSLHEQTNPRSTLFESSASVEAAGAFLMNEYGVAMWNVDDVVTAPETAWQYRVLLFELNTSGGNRADP